MVELFKNLNKKEKFIYELRNLFENYGYKNLSVNLLEDYESYSSGDLIKDENILKLIHPNGKLYALRPDMTTPIAKRFAREGQKTELSHKVYYSDKVFRIEQNAYISLSEINQMGVEALGTKDRATDLEILTLAKEVLSTINETYHIDISHSGVLNSLFKMTDLKKTDKETVIDLLGKRSKTDLTALLRKLGVEEKLLNAFILLTELNGNFSEVLDKFKNSEILKEFKEIICELEELKEYLDIYEIAVDIDLSISSNLKYYSGIIFKGYVPEIAEAVLDGGRYDNLAKTFGDDIPAIGFAVNLTEILSKFEEGNKPLGAIVFYEESNKNLIETVKELRSKTGLVRLEKNIDLSEEMYNRLKFEYKDLYIFVNGRLEEKKWK